MLEKNIAYVADGHVYFDVTTGLGSTGDLYRPMPGVINAAGRIADARKAFDLLTTDDAGRAHLLAQELDSLNRQDSLGD